jgi:hypothetical protein
LSKGGSRSIKKSSSDGNVSEELQEISIAEEGCNTAIYHLGWGQAELSALFYCLNYATKPPPPCEEKMPFGAGQGFSGRKALGFHQARWFACASWRALGGGL